MTRPGAIFTAGIVAALLSLAVASEAAGADGEIATYLNGHELHFDSAPVIYSGRMLVPARGYLEAMGARLVWDGDQRQIAATVPGREVVMTIDDPQALVNGVPVLLDVAPIIRADRTLIPLRFLSEALSAEVAYSAPDRRVDVTYQRPPSVSRSGAEDARSRAPTVAAAETQRVWVSDGPLNVRAGPGTDQPILTTVATGTVLNASASGPDWVRVRLDDGREAWVARAYVTPMDTGEDPGGLVSRLVALATGLVGAPYAWGGETPAGFDCSGFLKFVFAQTGLALPRATEAQAVAGLPVTDELRPGDILTFTTYAPGPSHTALYIGNNRFVHAANEHAGVTITSLQNPYWSARYLGARRVLSGG